MVAGSCAPMGGLGHIRDPPLARRTPLPNRPPVALNDG